MLHALKAGLAAVEEVKEEVAKEEEVREEVAIDRGAEKTD